jgi:rubrerythrin
MLRFNADEVYGMAEDLERTGLAFYTQAAERVADERLQKLLLSLAKMEQGHLRVFSDLRKKLPDEDRRQDSPELPEEVAEHAQYVRALVGSHVFGAVDEAWLESLPQQSSTEVLQRAIALEKDAIVFLLELQELVPRHRGRKDFDRIIHEELQHIRLLNARINTRSS